MSAQRVSIGLAWAFAALRAFADPSFVSINVNGGISPGYNTALDMTPDARYIVFAAEADDMVAGDINGYPDLVLLDRQTGAREILSIGATFGDLEPMDISYRDARITANARFVVFTTRAGGLAAGAEPTQDLQIFVRDRQAGQTIRLSDDQGEPLDGESFYPSISDDGRYLSFASYAANIGAGPADLRAFHLDLQSGQRVMLSRDRSGVPQAPVALAEIPHMSGDGRFVAFISGQQLLSEVTAGRVNAYLWDRDDDSLESLHRRSTGEIVDVPADVHAISRNGRYVLLWASATEITGDPTGEPHLMRKDLVTEALDPIDLDVEGRQLANVNPVGYHLASDGRFASFKAAKPLFPGIPPPGFGGTYFRDLQVTRSAFVPSFLPSTSSTPNGQLSDDGHFMLLTLRGAIYPPGFAIPEAKLASDTAGDVFLQDLSPTDLSVQLSQVAGTWNAVLTIDNNSAVEASFVVAKLTSDEPIVLAVPVTEDCRGASDLLPRDCYIPTLSAGGRRTIDLFFEPGDATGAELNVVVYAGEFDSNALNSTAHITMTDPAPLPPPGGGGNSGGGGGGASNWLETTGILALLLFQGAARRRNFVTRSHIPLTTQPQSV